jgi:hypothetical protein
MSFEFSYMLKRAGDGVIIDQTVREDTLTESSSERNSLPALDDMVKTIAARQLRYLYLKHDITPWQITEKRVFEEDKMKDPRMKQVKVILKKGVSVRSLACIRIFTRTALTLR